MCDSLIYFIKVNRRKTRHRMCIVFIALHSNLHACYAHGNVCTQSCTKLNLRLPGTCAAHSLCVCLSQSTSPRGGGFNQNISPRIHVPVWNFRPVLVMQQHVPYPQMCFSTVLRSPAADQWLLFLHNFVTWDLKAVSLDFYCIFVLCIWMWNPPYNLI